MSLVSVKNLVAPFTNSTHLVTIVLVTILFAIFRLQGGSVLVSRDTERGSAATGVRNIKPTTTLSETSDSSNSLDDLNTEINSFSKPSGKSDRNQAIPDTGTITITEEEEDLLGEMIGSKPLPPKREVESQVPKRQPGNSRQQGDSLEDIERSLGLR